MHAANSRLPTSTDKQFVRHQYSHQTLTLDLNHLLLLILTNPLSVTQILSHDQTSPNCYTNSPNYPSGTYSHLRWNSFALGCCDSDQWVHRVLHECWPHPTVDPKVQPGKVMLLLSVQNSCLQIWQIPNWKNRRVGWHWNHSPNKNLKSTQSIIQ